MGSHTITYAAVALAIAVISLLVGFFWGRSDLKSKIEIALEKASVALDAREFAMRQQLDEAFAQVARLRPLAEELGAVQERLKREQSKYERMKAEFNATVQGAAAELPANESQSELHPTESADEAIQKLLQSLEAFNAPEDVASASPSGAVADAIVPAPAAPQAQKVEPVVPPPLPAARAVPPAQVPQLRTSAEPVKPTQPAAATHQQPPLPQQPKSAPIPPKKAIPAHPQNVTPAEPRKPAPPPVPKAAPAAPAKSGQTLDEWQEFARQLEALTGKKK